MRKYKICNLLPYRILKSEPFYLNLIIFFFEIFSLITGFILWYKEIKAGNTAKERCYGELAKELYTREQIIKQFEINVRSYITKGFVFIIWYFSLKFGNFFFIGIYPKYNIISLILSILYAYFEKNSGPYMKCSLKSGDLCYGIAHTNDFLSKGCEYHNKNVIISWIEVGLYAFSILYYPLKYILIYLLKFVKNKWKSFKKLNWERSLGRYHVIIRDEEKASHKI
ncbi:hypothetical protein Glove_94g26 [Diversispora epigaea]|uniref:Uncharacterized protein n=1 Tax=Diversispora epigaea TaxID=1348612 RepID=A0A397J8R0_9GLOM|nr:hypothetical protein Glove_94g26 [Diversispora epigaea]